MASLSLLNDEVVCAKPAVMDCPSNGHETPWLHRASVSDDGGMSNASPVLCLGPDPRYAIGGAGSTVVTYEGFSAVHQKRKDWSSELLRSRPVGLLP